MVLDHDITILVGINAKVDVADALERVILEDDVASRAVTAKDEAGRGVLEIGRKAEDDGIVAVARGMRLKVTGVVFELIVRFNDVDFIVPYNIR